MEMATTNKRKNKMIKYRLMSRVPGGEWLTGKHSTSCYITALQWSLTTIKNGLSVCILHLEGKEENLKGSETFEANSGELVDQDLSYLSQ